MINKRAMLPIVIVGVIVLAILVMFFFKHNTGHSILGENVENDVLVKNVASLNSLNLTTVEKYDDYKQLTDNLNDFILIVNEQTKTRIPLLKNTQEDWSRASKLISKYSPLINNYNSMVLTAQDCKRDKTNESYQKFYGEIGKFSIELTFISAALFHEVTFNLVGGVFNSLGIGSLALKCPSCASTIMSGAYWTIKTTLVESVSQGSDYIFEKLGYKQEVKK